LAHSKVLLVFLLIPIVFLTGLILLLIAVDFGYIPLPPALYPIFSPSLLPNPKWQAIPVEEVQNLLQKTFPSAEIYIGGTVHDYKLVIKKSAFQSFLQSYIQNLSSGNIDFSNGHPLMVFRYYAYKYFEDRPVTIANGDKGSVGFLAVEIVVLYDEDSKKMLVWEIDANTTTVTWKAVETDPEIVRVLFW